MDTTPVFAIVDAVLGDAGADENVNDGRFDSLATVLNTRLEGRAGKSSLAVRDWVFDLVDVATARVEGAEHAAEWFQSHLRSLERTAINQAGHLRERIVGSEGGPVHRAGGQARAAANRPDAKWLREAQQRLVEYARLRLEQVTIASVALPAAAGRRPGRRGARPASRILEGPEQRGGQVSRAALVGSGLRSRRGAQYRPRPLAVATGRFDRVPPAAYRGTGRRDRCRVGAAVRQAAATI